MGAARPQERVARARKAHGRGHQGGEIASMIPKSLFICICFEILFGLDDHNEKSVLSKLWLLVDLNW